MRKRLYAPSFCALIALLVGCSSEPLTEVLIVVDTDFAVPGEIDAINVEVVTPSGDPLRSVGAIGSQADLPATVGVVHSGGPLGDVRVVASGSLGGTVVVDRRATFRFVEGETRILRIHLLRSCAGVSCMDGLTCGERGCRSVVVTADELEPYQPDLGRIDAGGPGDDAGMDAGVDGGSDAGPDVDASADAGSDAGPDATVTDAGSDAGMDAGPLDAGSDAGPDAGPMCTGLPATCGTGAAGCTCSACPCDVSCGASCEVTCMDSSSCNTDGSGSSNVDVTCSNSTCDIDAAGASMVTVVASAAADVELNCAGSSSCDLQCTGGSACLVRCVAASSCGISMCPTAVTSCPMLVRVCGRGCP